MEKAKKKLISSVVLAAIVLVVVFCALIFGQALQNNGADNSFVATAEQSEGMISGIYNEMSQSEAMAHYNSLTDYTPITNQSEFENYLGSGKPVGNSKYRLKPYDDNGDKITYTAKSAAYLDSTVIDGCGATVKIDHLDDITQLGSGGNTAQEVLNLPNGDSGYGTGTMFQFTPREVRFGLIKYDDEPVYIKVSGGFADYALGATISNINFEYTASFSREEGDPDAASYLYGGVFGAMSVNDAGTGTTVTNCRIYNGGTFSASKKVNGGARVGNQSRPYHATVAFGTLAGYAYNSSFTDSTVELSNSMSIYTYSVGTDQARNNTGTPRAVSAGAIGILQNDCLVSDIYITGGGTINGDVGTAYYETKNSAKLGLAGGLVGCVTDGNNSAEEFMIAGLGNAYIKNIVSNWQGNVIMKGNVHESYDYTTTINETGSLVGISGSYINNGVATNISGNYFIYNESKPTYRMVAYGNVRDKAFSYIQVVEDGTNWLTVNAADRNVDIQFSDDGNSLNLIYDVTDETDNRSILWSYTQNVVETQGTTVNTFTRWNQAGATSYETATKREVVSIANTATVNHSYSFVTGQAVFYKIEGEDAWSSTDSVAGSIGVRTYNTPDRQYDGTTVVAPGVQFYLNDSFTDMPIATSYDNTKWAAQINGSGSYISIGDEQTKNVNSWYLSFRTNESNDAYAYYAEVNGKNYVAYKAENVLPSEGSAPISVRYYVYNITQKIITPSVIEKAAADLIYDNTQKVYDVNFNGEIIAGDTVTANLGYYTVNGEAETETSEVRNVGDYRVKILSLSNGNYAMSDAVQAHDFSITKRTLTSTISDDTVFTYNATNQSPTVTVSNQISGVDQSAVISISYNKDAQSGVSNIDAGTYTVVVSLTVAGRANYELTGELEKEFTINPAELKFIGATEYSFPYDSIGISGTALTELEENPISIVSVDEALGYVSNFTAYFRKYREGDDTESGYSPNDIYDAGVYDCLIKSSINNNYVQCVQKIKLEITPSEVKFDIIPEGFALDDENTYDYDGLPHGFRVSYSGIGALDLDFMSFQINIYPATYDSENAKWVAQEGAEPLSMVTNAGNYIAVVTQTEGFDIYQNPNYNTSGDVGTTELPFTINKATLVWQFSGDGLDYNEESGEYLAEYNGQTFTLALNGGDLESQLVEGDKGKYSLTGNVEYICETEEGDYSVGTKGVRDAGNYRVEPEVNCGENPALSVNYEIKGGYLAITQRVVTIVIKDISVPYGTHFDEITGEGFSNMWSYAPGSNEFLPEDGNMLTFYLLDVPMDESPVRGTYPYTFRPSPVNPNVNNYQINNVYEAGDNADCTITGLELELEVVVKDKDGVEVVTPIAEGKTYATSALYNGGTYTVSLRATNLDPENPGIAWVTDSFTFVNNADGKAVKFSLTEEANAIYYIHEDLSEAGQADGEFTVTFSVDKRKVEITPVDSTLEYGADNGTIGANGVIVTTGEGFDGFVDGEQDWFTYSYSTDLGANVGSTAAINVTAVVKTEHQGAENNYEFSYKTGTVTRVAKVLNVTLNNRQKTYGSDPLTVSTGDYSVEGLIGDDTIVLEYVLYKDGEQVADAINLPVGTYSLGAILTNTQNYVLEIAEGATYDVDPKEVSVTFSSVEVEYDANEHPVNVKVEGYIAGDDNEVLTVNYFLNGEQIQGVPVGIGVYTVVAGEFASGNYTVGTVTGSDATVTITNVSVNVTVENAVSAYGTGDIVPAGGVYFTSDSALFDADDLQPYYVLVKGGNVAEMAVGTYADCVTLEFAGAAAGNYNINIVNAASLEVTVADLGEVAYLVEESSVYDGAAKTIEMGGVLDDQVSIEITRNGSPVTSIVDAGEYTVTVTSDSENYTGSATLTYKVEKAVFDGTTTAVSSVYDGNAVTLSVDAEYGEVIFSYVLNGNPVDEIKNAGVYTVTITAGENSNYTGSAEVTYTVEKATAPTPSNANLTITAVWNGITVAGKNGELDAVIILKGGNWDGATDSITGLNPDTEYEVAIRFNGNDNYFESGIFLTKVKTSPKEAAVIGRDDVTYTVYYNKIVLEVSGDDEFVYSLDGGKTWKSGNEITGLEAGTVYNVSVKLTESATHGESNVLPLEIATGADPAEFNKLFDAMGDTVTAADIDNYDKMMEAYEALGDGDKEGVDKTKLNNLKAAYDALIAEVNGDVIAAQNVARKAAGKGAAAAAASVLAVVVAAMVAKKKFVF